MAARWGACDMDTNFNLEQVLIAGACKDNAEAIDFVNRALSYFHAIDDLVDENTTAEFKIRLLIAGQELYSHVYFARHAHWLNAIIRNCASTYADSVAWEHSADPAKQAHAEVWRHCGLELLFAVADLCGGWEHRRNVARDVRDYNLACAQAEKQKATICP